MTEVKQGWERILYGVDYVTPRLNGGGGGGGLPLGGTLHLPFSSFTPSVLLPPSLKIFFFLCLKKYTMKSVEL